MKVVRATGAGIAARHSGSNMSYAASIIAVIIISSVISFSVYFHRSVKPAYFDFVYKNNQTVDNQNHSTTYLSKATSLVSFAGSSILDAFSRNSPEENSYYCDNSTSIWCSIPMPAERSESTNYCFETYLPYYLYIFLKIYQPLPISRSAH